MRVSLLLFLATLGSLGVVAEMSQVDIRNVVLLVTTGNYPDAYIAAVVANKIGAVVLFTHPEELPAETLEQLKTLNPETTYLIGGPVVISEAVEKQLKGMGHEVVRLWGVTAYGTASEVVEFFYPEGANEAVIVWDEGGSIGDPAKGKPNEKMLALAKDLAQSKGVPLLLVPKDELPLRVKETLRSLEVKRITLVGEHGKLLRDELKEIGIEVEEIPGLVEEVERKVKERTRKEAEKRGEAPICVIVAIANWWDTINAPYHPGVSVTRLISEEDHISKAVEEAKNCTRVLVVGVPWLANKTCEAMRAVGIEATCHIGKPPAWVAVQVMEREKGKIEEIRRKFKAVIRVSLKAIEEECNQILGRALGLVINVTLEPVVNLTAIAPPAAYGDLMAELSDLWAKCLRAVEAEESFEAFKKLRGMKERLMMIRWRLKEVVKEEVEIERDKERLREHKFREKFSPILKAAEQTLKEVEKRLATIENLSAECRAALEELRNSVKRGEVKKAKEAARVIPIMCARELSWEIMPRPPVREWPTNVTNVTPLRERKWEKSPRSPWGGFRCPCSS